MFPWLGWVSQVALNTDNCPILEAIDLIAELSGREVAYSVSSSAPSGDHYAPTSMLSETQLHKTH
jgi:hypothetical protein